jgi:hypothetical protein
VDLPIPGPPNKLIIFDILKYIKKKGVCEISHILV